MAEPAFPIGVLIMAYGGPDSLDDIPAYLADIRGGRPVSPTLLEEITEHYRLIGGKSPLLEITTRQVSAIADRLDPDRFRCYMGMRHWTPWIEDAVAEMLDDDVTHAVSLVLAPHYSQLSVAKYHEKIARGLELHQGHLEFVHIDGYHDAPRYIQALANRVLEGVGRWPPREQGSVHVVFSAHSLPVRILESGDPYDSQVRETARLVAQRAGLPDDRWSWSYQSAGRSPEPWLGPGLQEHIPVLAAEGVRNIVSVPVGFVSDHVEILYDIDIEARQIAQAHRVRLERPPALNDDPLFIEALVELILQHAGRLNLEQP